MNKGDVLEILEEVVGEIFGNISGIFSRLNEVATSL
jgi:hypothetical protein